MAMREFSYCSLDARTHMPLRDFLGIKPVHHRDAREGGPGQSN